MKGLLLGGVVLAAIPACEKKREFGPPRAVPVAEDGTLRLRLMTFNIRHEDVKDAGSRAWHHRVAAVVRMIREERVDVIGVQEAMHGQVADLWASLPDYEFLGAGRADGRRSGEYTGFFYLRERFELDLPAHGFFWLSATPDVAGSRTWGNDYPRMVTWGRLTDRASGRMFLLYNTHWSHHHQDSRIRAAGLMGEHMRSRRRNGEPLVVMGDFNAVSTNPAIARLVKLGAGESLVNAYDARHPQEGPRNTLHFWSGQVAGALRVDHIFASSPVTIKEARIRDSDLPLLSDHFPVIAEVHFPPPGEE